LALAALVWGVLLLVLAWSDNVRRKSPGNLALLFLLTIAQGLLMGAAGATWHSRVPVVFLLLSATVSLALIAYASQTAVDLTASGGMLFAAFVILVSVILADTWLAFNTLQLLIGGCAALLFSAWVVCDVLMAATGESSYVVAADEYVFATINVYTDMISVSMYLLQVCTTRNYYDFEFS
jgi:FtsH-binding integral membrane protein